MALNGRGSGEGLGRVGGRGIITRIYSMTTIYFQYKDKMRKENTSIGLACRQVSRAFTWLMIGMGRPTTLWMVWSCIVHQSKLNHLQERIKPESSTPP